MSIRTTSAKPASRIRWAVVAPTLPAPTTVTLWRPIRSCSLRLSGRRSGSVVDAGPGGANARRQPLGVGLEVGGEHPGELRGSMIVRGAILPGVARLEELGRHVRTADRNGQSEARIHHGR